MTISKVLANNLILIREKKGLTVSELSKKCKVSRQAIYQIESGENWIGLPLIRKLSNVLNIEEHELFQAETSVK